MTINSHTPDEQTKRPAPLAADVAAVMTGCKVGAGAGAGRCRAVRFISPPGRVTALASFPGSGNTWVRHLIQQLTGLATGSVYRAPALACGGFPGESRQDGSVVVVKTHCPTSPRLFTTSATVQGGKIIMAHNQGC